MVFFSPPLPLKKYIYIFGEGKVEESWFGEGERSWGECGVVIRRDILLC